MDIGKLLPRKKIILHAIDNDYLRHAMEGWTIYKAIKLISSESKDKNSVELDVVTALDMTLNSKVSSHAVEYGVDVSDHLKPENKSISLSAKIADLDLLGFSIGSIGLDKNILEKIELLESWVIKSTLLFFLGYSDDKQEIPIMAITSLKVSKPVKTGKLSRDIQITLSKIEIADSSITDILKIKRTNPPKKTVKPSAKGDEKSGKVVESTASKG